jgi:hypothetical protein
MDVNDIHKKMDVNDVHKKMDVNDMHKKWDVNDMLNGLLSYKFQLHQSKLQNLVMPT